jgi:hypothetical protein
VLQEARREPDGGKQKKKKTAFLGFDEKEENKDYTVRPQTFYKSD